MGSTLFLKLARLLVVRPGLWVTAFRQLLALAESGWWKRFPFLPIPNKELIALPNDHEIFNSFFSFPNGLPKIHEHDGKPPEALALFEGDRMILLYTYESDLGDGWEDQSVHNNPQKIRLKALQMGANIIGYVMDQNSIK